MEYIAFDSHKRYTFASVSEHTGNVLSAGRINHRRGAITQFLSAWKPGTAVAVETVGKWYWIVDEIEAAGMVPQLVHARRAKLMLGSVNKTDKLDARIIADFCRTQEPTLWQPPAPEAPSPLEKFQPGNKQDLESIRTILFAQEKARIRVLEEQAAALAQVDQALGQGLLLPMGDHPADHIAAEDIHDHVQVKISPFGRSFGLRSA